jgi:hypothetical protein
MCRPSDFVFESQALLHEVGRVQLAVRNSGDRNGGRQALGLASGEAHESSPQVKPESIHRFAATVASMALLTNPDAIGVPPAVPSNTT